MSPPKRLSGVAAYVLLPIAYVVLGRVALLLAVPPGYATAIFPPAGLGVASVLVWGNRAAAPIWLGSLLLNLWLGISSGAGLSARGLAAAACIATGSAFQALASAHLVRRSIGYPTTLSLERDIALFLFFGGPIACVVSPLVSVTSLLALGIVPTERYLESLFTWWVGDTIGVLVTAPVVLSLFGAPDSAWRPRRATVAAPLLMCCLAVVLLFVQAGHWEQQKTALQLRGVIQFAGFAFTALLGAFLLLISGRTRLVEALVERRTEDLRGVLSTSLEAIVTVDEQGLVETTNPAAERLFGAGPGALVGRELEALVPDFYEADGMTPRALGERRDTMGKRGDGSSVPIEIGVSLIPSSGRSRFAVVMHDIVERRRVDRLKDELISTVSHELRTPATTIHGSLRLLHSGMGGELPELARELAGMAMQGSSRLVVLIDDILEIGKLELHQAAFAMKSADPALLLSEAIAQNVPYASQYNVRLAFEPPAGPLPAIVVDPSRFLQVITNLLSNAAKFSPEGGLVTVRASRHSGGVRISVEDHGPGIPESFRSRIFTKFAQADGSDRRARGGTGLGLSIVKVIVERMGGQVGYESTLGRGTTFFVDVPAAEDAATSEANEPSSVGHGSV